MGERTVQRRSEDSDRLDSSSAKSLRVASPHQGFVTPASKRVKMVSTPSMMRVSNKVKADLRWRCEVRGMRMRAVIVELEEESRWKLQGFKRWDFTKD